MAASQPITHFSQPIPLRRYAVSKLKPNKNKFEF